MNHSRTRIRILLSGTILCICIPVWSQYLVSAESLGTRSQSELELELGQTVRTGVSLYKLLYMTTDLDGTPDTASGLLVLPDAALLDNHPMVIYQHGTTNGPSDAPSRLSSGSDEALAYGSMGYVTIAADYLGLGDHDGFHPYLHAASEASAALDLLFAATEWIENQTGEAWVGNLFISGYSQGGHAAAALQKELESNWSLVYPVTASTPMSGPYSLSGVMYSRIISEETYFTPAYIIYITLGYQEAYGNLFTELTDLFKPAYVATIENFRNHTYSTTELNFYLVLQIAGELGLGVCKPKIMFKDSVLQSIITEENHPFRVALRENDLYDWVPQAPTRLYYCTADEQVPYRNSIVADSVMQVNGAPDVAAVNFGALTHGGCAVPAIQASIEFFDSFILSGTEAPDKKSTLTDFVSGNPVSGVITVLPEYTGQGSDINLYDLTGTLVYGQSIQEDGIVDVSMLASGIYIAELRQRDILQATQKVIIIN